MGECAIMERTRIRVGFHNMSHLFALYLKFYGENNAIYLHEQATVTMSIIYGNAG